MSKTYGFQLRNGHTITVEADGMHEAIALAEQQSGTIVVRGQEHIPGPHRSDFDGIQFTADERAGFEARR